MNMSHMCSLELLKCTVLVSCDYTGCGNITSFFIIRGNQAVEVVAGGCVFILETRF